MPALLLKPHGIIQTGFEESRFNHNTHFALAPRNSRRHTRSVNCPACSEPSESLQAPTAAALANATSYSGFVTAALLDAGSPGTQSTQTVVALTPGRVRSGLTFRRWVPAEGTDMRVWVHFAAEPVPAPVSGVFQGLVHGDSGLGRFVATQSPDGADPGTLAAIAAEGPWEFASRRGPLDGEKNVEIEKRGFSCSFVRRAICKFASMRGVNLWRTRDYEQKDCVRSWADLLVALRERQWERTAPYRCDYPKAKASARCGASARGCQDGSLQGFGRCLAEV